MHARLIGRSAVALAAAGTVAIGALATAGPASAGGYSCTLAPTVSGTPQVGQVLTAPTPAYHGLAGGLVPVTKYAWYRSGSGTSGSDQVIPGATAATYTPVAADVGHSLYVKERGVVSLAVATLTVPCAPAVSHVIQALTPGSATSTTSSTSSTTSSSGTTPVPATKPSMTGAPTVGSTLQGVAATPVPGTTVQGYQWYVIRNVRGHERWMKLRIKGADHRWMKLRKEFLGRRVLLGVTYVKPGMTPQEVFSHAVRVRERRREN